MGNQRAINMADSGQSAPFGGGFGGGQSKGGGKGDDRRKGKGKGKGKSRDEKEQWVPCTKLGRLVKEGKIAKIDDIYFYSLAIKEAGIVDFFLKDLKDEVMKIQPVQKQTSAGQRMKFKAFVIVGDMDGHVGLGVKGAKEVATAIRGAILKAKLSVVPVLRGYWGNKIGREHTVPCKVTGKCGSVRMRLIPAPRGTGLVASRASKRVLQYAGVEDVYTATKGATSTMGNFIKATFEAIKNTYNYNMPAFWEQPDLSAKKMPQQEFTDWLKEDTAKRIASGFVAKAQV